MSNEHRIGRYVIKGKLNHGGMGTVLRAYDPHFERDIAIKIMPRAFINNATFRKRFEREAKIIASLQHPCIVSVYDFNEYKGQPYIVMRFMHGGSLEQHLKKGPVNLKTAAKILRNIGHALDKAHKEGIVHRDLKPGNILFDEHGNAFLADFGIAQLSNSSIVITSTNAILGTPAYMSPEQVQANVKVSYRSDIYSLGIILYEMLTGQVPFKGETPAKTMMMHILQPVPKILDINPDLPPKIQEIIDRSMAKEPEQRFDSAISLVKAVFLLAQGAEDDSFLAVGADKNNQTRVLEKSEPNIEDEFDFDFDELESKIKSDMKVENDADFIPQLDFDPPLEPDRPQGQLLDLDQLENNTPIPLDDSFTGEQEKQRPRNNNPTVHTEKTPPKPLTDNDTVDTSSLDAILNYHMKKPDEWREERNQVIREMRDKEAHWVEDMEKRRNKEIAAARFRHQIQRLVQWTVVLILLGLMAWGSYMVYTGQWNLF